MSEQDNAVLDTVEPKEVFSLFRLLTRIPRGSGNEKAVSDCIRDRARGKGFAVKQDSLNNLLIRKPGVNANPDAPAVILQAHLDMVCVAEPGYDFDFDTQPITVRIDGDLLRADRTTLGADDGIGVALALALLESENVDHPPLEIVLTTNEETGLTGAAGFDATDLTGKYFINIDTEEEGYFYASCAGGVRLDLTFPIDSAPPAQHPGKNGDSELAGLALSVSGLKGGHSGMEIDKERGNSHRLTARILRQLCNNYDAQIHSIHGGMADNAIPAETKAVLAVQKSDLDAIAQDMQTWQKTFRNELKASDGSPGPDGTRQEASVAATPCPTPGKTLLPESRDNVLLALMAIPTGVAAMDLNRPEQLLPETSSNLAVVDISGSHAHIRVSVRSQLESKKQFVRAQIETIAKAVGGTIAAQGEYPGWEYEPSSPLRSLFAQTYTRLTGQDAVILGVHAGLECGLFAEKTKEAGKHIDFTSIGPDLRAVHTPKENLGISSTGRTWALLKEVMAQLAR